MTDDVVMADIPDQAVEIFLHGPESAHKNGIVKTNIHSHIHSHSPIHTPKRNKKQNPELTQHDDFLYLSSFCPLRCCSTARKLGTCSSGLLHVRGLLA